MRKLIVTAMIAAFVVVSFGQVALAEVSEVRFARQRGLGYLQLIVMQFQGLFEKHAKAAGLDAKSTWGYYAGGGQATEAILADNLDFASGGLGPLAKAWDKTKGRINIKGVTALARLPFLLNTNKPEIKSLRDITSKDRISVPAIKVSIQAVLLQMAAKKEFGQFDKLDRLTVSMKHPDAAAALASRKSVISLHFASVPIAHLELENPKIHNVISSFDILGGPHTSHVLFTRESFVKKNPKTYQAVLAALREATEWINADKRRAARKYLDWIKRKKMTAEQVYKFITSPNGAGHSLTPIGVTAVTDFLHSIGSLKNKPASWKDLFFPDIHDLPGN